MDGINEAALAAREREEAEWEKRPVIAVCIACGEPIRGRTEKLGGDWYVETEDGPVHWDCWDEYDSERMKEG